MTKRVPNCPGLFSFLASMRFAWARMIQEEAMCFNFHWKSNATYKSTKAKAKRIGKAPALPRVAKPVTPVEPQMDLSEDEAPSASPAAVNSSNDKFANLQGKKAISKQTSRVSSHAFVAQGKDFTATQAEKVSRPKPMIKQLSSQKAVGFSTLPSVAVAARQGVGARDIVLVPFYSNPVVDGEAPTAPPFSNKKPIASSTTKRITKSHKVPSIGLAESSSSSSSSSSAVTRKWKRSEDDLLLDAYRVWIDKYFTNNPVFINSNSTMPDPELQNPLISAEYTSEVPSFVREIDQSALDFDEFASNHISGCSSAQIQERRQSLLLKRHAVKPTINAYSLKNVVVRDADVVTDDAQLSRAHVSALEPLLASCAGIVKIIIAQEEDHYNNEWAAVLLDGFTDEQVEEAVDALLKDKQIIRNNDPTLGLRSFTFSSAFENAVKDMKEKAKIWSDSIAMSNFFDEHASTQENKTFGVSVVGESALNQFASTHEGRGGYVVDILNRHYQNKLRIDVEPPERPLAKKNKSKKEKLEKLLLFREPEIRLFLHDDLDFLATASSSSSAAAVSAAGAAVSADESSYAQDPVLYDRVVKIITAAGADEGHTVSDLYERYRHEHKMDEKAPVASWGLASFDVRQVWLQTLNDLVREQKVLKVMSTSELRYVASEHAALWTIPNRLDTDPVLTGGSKPYVVMASDNERKKKPVRSSSSSTKEKEPEEPTVNEGAGNDVVTEDQPAASVDEVVMEDEPDLEAASVGDEEVKDVPRTHRMRKKPQRLAEAVSDTEVEATEAAAQVSLAQSIFVLTMVCNVCHKDEADDKLILCSAECAEGCCHTYCCDPPLDAVPEGDWFCKKCSMNDDDFTVTDPDDEDEDEGRSEDDSEYEKSRPPRRRRRGTRKITKTTRKRKTTDKGADDLSHLKPIQKKRLIISDRPSSSVVIWRDMSCFGNNGLISGEEVKCAVLIHVMHNPGVRFAGLASAFPVLTLAELEVCLQMLSDEGLIKCRTMYHEQKVGLFFDDPPSKALQVTRYFFPTNSN